MESVKRLVVNIVTWNSARHLPELFASLDRQTARDFSIAVIDNASTDETLSWLEEHRHDASLLRNFRNLGFSRAHNQGIALAVSRWQSEADLSSRYIFVLNPDIQLAPNCIEELLAYMDAHPDVAIAGPKLYKALIAHGQESDAVSIEQTDVLDSMGLTIHRGRQIADRGAGESDRGQYDRTAPFGISGAAMIIRASYMQDLALSGSEIFDEQFFAYKEDADLCWRARLFGLQIEIVPSAIAWHVRAMRDPGGKKVFRAFSLLHHTWSRPSAIVRASRRNQMWMEWKNDDGMNRFFHIPWIFWRGILAIGACFVVPQYVLACFEAWRGRPAMAAKRRLIQARRKVNPEEMRKWFV